MPSIHIPEETFGEYADKWGYNEAKDVIKGIVKENAPEESNG